MEIRMADAKQYKILTKIHIGGVEPPTALEVGEKVVFDGITVRRANGDVLSLPQPASFRGAIKTGWAVPVESEVNTFVPKAAGVEVRSATSTGRERELTSGMSVVADEERDLGHLSKVRPDNAPDVHSAKDAGTVSKPQGAKTPEVVRDDDGGVVVGRMKLSAKADAVEIGKNDSQIKNRLDNGGRAGVNPVVVREEEQVVGKAVATGDVEEAIASESLEELLPEAASAGTPEAGVFEDKPRVAEHRSAPKDPEQALRNWVEKGESWDEAPVTMADVRVLARAVLRKVDVLRPLAEQAAAEPTPDNGGGEVEWDTSVHWKTREVALAQYADNPEALQYIYEVDTSKGVRKKIDSLLGR